GGDRRPWKRRAPSYGDHRGDRSHRLCRKFSGGSSVRRGGPAEAQGKEGEGFGMKERIRINGRKRTLLLFLTAAVLLVGIGVAGAFCYDAASVTDFCRKDRVPCLAYTFGTDSMGRDMQKRTLAGLSQTPRIGLLTAGISACLAVVLAT